MKRLKAMVIAFSIYSKIPVPQFEWKEEDMEYMMCFFPWIGGVIGLFFYGWAVLCEKFAVGNVCYALIAAAIPLMISGGFHVDGYMDTMDAFHSYQSREKKLEILQQFQKYIPERQYLRWQQYFSWRDALVELQL